MIDVRFEENECDGNCAAMLSARDKLRNLRVTNNVAINPTTEMSAVIYCAPESTM